MVLQPQCGCVRQLAEHFHTHAPCAPHTSHPQADPPEFSRIPPDDIVGVTVILLTCSYREKVRWAGEESDWLAVV